MNRLLYVAAAETAGAPAVAAGKMPGHWLLAKMGKRVLRPGGLELSRVMLERLAIQSRDAVVEFAPGMGVTARMTLRKSPASYTAVERDARAAERVKNYLSGPTQQCQLGSAEETGLPSQSATVVYGEAMLTMQGTEQKQRIVAEAFRLLKPGGRYGIHEMTLLPDDLPLEIKQDINRTMTHSIHVGTRALTVREWRELLTAAGFQIQSEITAPMLLLEPLRIFRDEGFFRALRFGFNVLRTPEVRRRVLAMRRTFRRQRAHIGALALVAVKP